MRRLALGAVLWLATLGARRRAWAAQDDLDTDRFLASLRDVS
jgi:hypothetical protein